MGTQSKHKAQNFVYTMLATVIRRVGTEASTTKQEEQIRRLYLPEETTTESLALLLQEAFGMTTESMRIIANNKELDNGFLLANLGEFWFHKNAIYLLEVDQNACREWQRTGRCCHGHKCHWKLSHDMHHSPRYVAHNHDANSPSSAVHSSPQTSPPTSPEINPRASSPETSPCVNHMVCRNWANTGTCRFGSQCHYAHSHTPDSHNASSTDSANSVAPRCMECEGRHQWEGQQCLEQLSASGQKVVYEGQQVLSWAALVQGGSSISHRANSWYSNDLSSTQPLYSHQNTSLSKSRFHQHWAPTAPATDYTSVYGVATCGITAC